MKTFKINNAIEIWKSEASAPSIPTLSQNLDNVLGNGGIEIASITELLGSPGSGKTQLCLQLCASVQIPKVLGGLESEALYIDTNNDFTLSRFREILSATLKKCQNLLFTSFNIKEEDALKYLHYVNAFGLVKFCAVMHSLANYIADNHNIKLIVIDSIAFPFKEGISTRQRTGLLFRQMAELQRIAFERRIAVVLTNEMSTRVGLPSGAVVGSLGDSWSHRCNKRLLLSQPQNYSPVRHAVLLYSNNSQNKAGQFQITQEGIRDVE